MRRAAVADAQPPLQQGSGRLAKLPYQLYRIGKKRVVFRFTIISALAIRARGSRLSLIFRNFEELLLVLC